MAEPVLAFAPRRVEIFSAGCRTCRATIEDLRAQIDGRHHIAVHDMQVDSVAEHAESLGVRTVPAVVVDGHLLACCHNTGPTRAQLEAAGLT